MANILKLKGVAKNFGRFRVINGVDLDVREGERHALIGPNGAGKSTLFNLITGHYVPSGGIILFKGTRIDGLPPYKIVRLGIARSFQIINTFKGAHGLRKYEECRSGATGVNHEVFSRTPIYGRGEKRVGIYA